MAKWMRWMPRNPAAVLRGLVGGIASLLPSPPDEDGPRPDVDGRRGDVEGDRAELAAKMVDTGVRGGGGGHS